MKVKDVKIKKIEKLLKDTDDELYLVSITFEGAEPVLNLYKPYDDSELRAENARKFSEEYQNWVKHMDEYFKQHPEL